MHLFARTFGWDPALVGQERLRLNPASSGQKTLDSLTADEAEALRCLNEIDLATYLAAKTLFERACQQFDIGGD